MVTTENFEHHIDEVKLLISRGDISDALDKLQGIAAINGVESEVIHLLNSFSNLRAKEIKGVISHAEISIERSKLIDNTLAVCKLILNKQHRVSRKSNKRMGRVAMIIGGATVFVVSSIFITRTINKRQVLKGISDVEFSETASIDTFRIRFPVSSNEVRFGGANPLPKADFALAQVKPSQLPSNSLNIDVLPNLSSLEYFKLGLTYRQSKIFDKALAYFNKSILENDKFVNAYIERGVTYRILEDYEKALEDYSKAISLENSIAQIYVNRSVVYFLLEMYDLAEADCHKAARLDDTLPELHLSMGNVYLGKKMYPEAIAAFKKALSLKDLYVNAIYGLSFAYFSAGDKANYCEIIEKYKNLDGSVFITGYSRTLCGH